MQSRKFVLNEVTPYRDEDWQWPINIESKSTTKLNMHVYNARELPLVSMLVWDVFHSVATLTRFVALRHSQPSHKQTDKNKDALTASMFELITS